MSYEAIYGTIMGDLAEALLRQDFDTEARAFLMKNKREEQAILKTLRAYPDREAKAQRFQRLLEGVPTGLECSCCGRKELLHLFTVEGHLVGSECKNHIDAFPCSMER